jgi:hypothetical protein
MRRIPLRALVERVRSTLRSFHGCLFRRTLLGIIFALVAHLFRWDWLRFATSELILRFSDYLGLISCRISLDEISVRGTAFQFATSCTFVDVVVGELPLIWKREETLGRNVLRVALTAFGLLGFNTARLEMAQLLYASGVPWIIADGVLGGLAYFVVWYVLTHPVRLAGSCVSSSSSATSKTTSSAPGRSSTSKILWGASRVVN